MRHLDRSSVSEPGCLRRHSRSGDTDWEQLTSQERNEVREALSRMQSKHCAYCESIIGSDAHIEHFRPRNAGHGHAGHPELVFAWENLLLSCNAADHCGIYKDSGRPGPYSPDDILDPCMDYPESVLRFSPSGCVSVAEGDGVSCQLKEKARSSIRVLGLNSVSLVQRRRDTLRKWAGSAEAYKGFSKEELDGCLSAQPFKTAILQILRR